VIGTVRSSSDEAAARRAGAHDVFLNDRELPTRLVEAVPQGIDHVVEVAFGTNLAVDLEVLRAGGSIASYATDASTPTIPFWPLVFKNVGLYFLGSDDFPMQAKLEAVQDVNAALEAGWRGFEIAERIPIAEIAQAHELLEHPRRPGRLIVTV